jgi:catechol 2,3-dioxygenase-like lactoylglutathione lyase family enzyme
MYREMTAMSRLQLALNVADLDASIGFYRDLFATEPHKVREGYANFEVSDPPLKLVLIETPGRGSGVDGALNHLGVEVAATTEVRDATTRMASLGHRTQVQDDTTCCHAVQDKVWVEDPARLPWEVYTVTDDAPAAAATEGETCCVTTGAVDLESACC